ncbi:metallophosphoesterase [Zhongshania sp. BJYM1]|uniref:metallophosphoesterase n=1 Tax=Zhongshania aquatica TaxID=2965069 RepID=UPI0022B56DA1|nr:metallophosphoesterase [Marortus sp. BJYM1]
MPLKIHVSSDLHLEFDANAAPEFPEEADVIILAGDIWLADDVPDYVIRVATDHPNAHVILVLGNHEYYYQNYHDVLPSIKSTLAAVSNASVLENESIIINDVLFLGCTLWTGFDAVPGVSPTTGKRDAEVNVYDFHIIKNGNVVILPFLADAQSRS